MTDYSKLRALAEAAESVKPGRWFIHRDGMGPEFEPHPRQNFGVDDGQGCVVVWHGVERLGGIPYEEVAEFIAAANPAAVLELIAELEKFDAGMRALACSLSAGGYNAVSLSADQLVDKVNAGLEMFTTSTGGLLDKVAAERDQLRAENAGLETGYEAYEQVNAELRGEVEESEAVIDQLSKILAGVAVAIKGEELPLHRHGYHDLVELVYVLKLENDLRKGENEALSKDAERYAHLKGSWGEDVLLGHLDSNVHPKDWDRVIDAAMSKEAQS